MALAKVKVLRIDTDVLSEITFKDWLAMREGALQELKAVVERPRTENPTEIAESLNDLTMWLSYSADLLSEVKALYAFFYGAKVKEYAALNYSASHVTAMAKKEVWAVEKTLTELDRRNAALVHTIDAARSQLSYQKQILQNTNSTGRN